MLFRLKISGIALGFGQLLGQEPGLQVLRVGVYAFTDRHAGFGHFLGTGVYDGGFRGWDRRFTTDAGSSSLGQGVPLRSSQAIGGRGRCRPGIIFR